MVAYIDTLAEKIDAKREELTDKFQRAQDVDNGLSAEDRAVLVDECNALHAEITPLEKQYADLGRAQAKLEADEAMDATAPLRRAASKGGGSGLTFERMEECSGDDGKGWGWMANVPDGMPLARALMESESFQTNPKMMGRDVVLPGLLDRALGPAINATPEELRRASTVYGAEDTQNVAAGFRTEIPFTGEVVPRGHYMPMMVGVVPRVNVDRLALTWLLQTARTSPSAADMQVAEGAAAPEATFTWTPQRVNLRRVRAWVPVTEDALASEMLLQALLETDLVGIVREQASRQIVQGDGVGNNISGFATTRAGQQNVDYIGNANEGENYEAAIQSALLNIKKGGYTMASHIVTNPEAFDPMMNIQRDGWYLFSPVADPATLRYRGVPIVESFGDFVPHAEDTVAALVGDFVRFSRNFTMGDVSIASTMSHGERFIDFEVVFRAGIWCEFVVTRNAAFCTITRNDS